MAKIISFTNNKWWVWKTSTAVNLSTILSEKYKKKVLVLDLDQQCNLTQALLQEKRFEKDQWSSELFRLLSKTPVEELIIEVSKNLHIIPGNLDDVTLLDSELEILHTELREHVKPNLEYVQKNFNTSEWKDKLDSSLELIDKLVLDKETWVKILKKRLSEVGLNYDYIFLDLPPSVSRIPKNAWVSSDYLLVPISDVFASHGTEQLITKMIEIIKEYNPELKILFFFNKVPITSNVFWKDWLGKNFKKIMEDFTEAIQENDLLSSISYTFESAIRESKDLEQAYLNNTTLLNLEKEKIAKKKKQWKKLKDKEKSKVLEDYMDLAEELIEITE